MKTYFFNELSENEIQSLLLRPAIDLEKIFEIVKPILNDIKMRGLESAVDYAKQFDGFTGRDLKDSEEEFDNAERELDGNIKEAINTAADNIRKYHEKQIPQSYKIETMKGINCRREFRAIENAGLYIPGGTAVLPSTMLMLGIPARIAGCKRIAACSPAKENK